MIKDQIVRNDIGLQVLGFYGIDNFIQEVQRVKLRLKIELQLEIDESQVNGILNRIDFLEYFFNLGMLIKVIKGLEDFQEGDVIHIVHGLQNISGNFH